MARAITIAVLAVTWLGCGLDKTAPQGSSSIETNAAMIDGLLVQVAVHPRVLERGETLQIRLMVTNPGNTVTRKAFSSGCIYGYSVTDDGGVRLAPAPPVCTANAPVVTYAPREVVTREFEWVYEDPSIPAGRYEVSAGFGLWGEGGPPPVTVTLK